MPKCVMFQNGIAISPNGNIRPCCHIDFVKQEDGGIIDWDKLHISNYHSQIWKEEFNRLEKIQETDWLPECRQCKRSEVLEKDSPRLKYNEMYENVNGIVYWDLKISNTCNLMCRMCGPGSSSIWKQNIKNSEYLNSVVHNFDTHNWHSSHLDFIKKEIVNAHTIKFTGGEPMLVKHVKEVINYLIEIGVSKNINLKFITNATVPFTSYWQNVFTQFKSIKVDVTIDGTGSRFEYIRAGANWDQVNANVQSMLKFASKHENINVAGGGTLQALNASVMNETQVWAESIGLDFDWGSEIFDPDFMTFASLNENLRNRYNIESETPFDPKKLEQLKKYMYAIDKIYGTDFKVACPEFFEDSE